MKKLVASTYGSTMPLYSSELAEEAEDADSRTEALSELDEVSTELDSLELESLFFDEYDEADAIISVHAGSGGVDAQDWAEMMARMYQRFLADKGFSVTVEEVSEGEEAGIKSATFTVKGDRAYGTLESERGVHRLVRISPLRCKLAASYLVCRCRRGS